MGPSIRAVTSDPGGASKAIDAPPRALVVRPAMRFDRGPVSVEFLLGYFDLAVAGALDYGRYEGLYLGPWWDVPADPERGVRGWKRAVLRRRPASGAVHWGHLFLICMDRPSVIALEPETLTRISVGPREAVNEFLLRDGSPRLVLLARPTTEDRKEPLSEFADDVAERFRRQLD